MHGWHCYIFKTYPLDKLSKLRTTGPWFLREYSVWIWKSHCNMLYSRSLMNIMFTIVLRWTTDYRQQTTTRYWIHTQFTNDLEYNMLITVP